MDNENNIELSGIFSDGYGINPKKLWKMKLDEQCGHGRGKYVKMVLSYLLSYTGAGSKEAWPSIATIAGDLECGRDIVIEALQHAEELKMIRKIKMFPNDPLKNNNKYILDFIEVGNSDFGCRKERLSTSDGATFEVATIDTNNNTINNIPINNKNHNKFLPPSLPEVLSYMKEIHVHNPEHESNQFLNYHSSKGWIVGRSKMKDWKAAVRTWKGNQDKWNPKPVESKPNRDEERAAILRGIKRGVVPRPEIDAAVKAGLITQGEADA